MKRTIDFSRMSFVDASTALQFCDSYSRLSTLIDLHYRMDETDWLRLLGQAWSSFDNIGQNLDDLISTCPLISRSGTIPEMMNIEEQAAYDALPDVLTIYRGCYKTNKWGLSWSLDREVAISFPSLSRYSQSGQALLVTAQVKKANTVALKLDRNESEIITFRPKHISTRHIKSQSAPPSPANISVTSNNELATMLIELDLPMHEFTREEEVVA